MRAISSRNTLRVCVGVLVGAAHVAGADVGLDGTVGGAGDRAIPAGNGFTYDLAERFGERRGGNLFFSFEAFEVARGESAGFTPTAPTAHIISRVTGAEGMQVDGALVSTASAAHVWFVSPHGIRFGAGAEVDVAGGLSLATADTLRFDDGAELNAEVGARSTLTMAAPASFGFLEGSSGAIEVAGRLRAPDDAIRLIGGEVTVEGANLAASRIQISGVRPATPAGGSDAPAGSGVRITDSRLRAEARLAPGGTLTPVADEAVRGNGPTPGVELEDSAVVISGGELKLVDTAVESADGAGDVALLSARIEAGGTVVDTSTRRRGAGGDIVVRAGELEWADGFLEARTLLPENARAAASTPSDPPGGDINIRANNFRLTGLEAGLGTSTQTRGRGGDIAIAVDDFAIDGADIYAVSEGLSPSGSGGRAGSVRVETPSLRMRRSASIASGTASSGASGGVVVDAGAITLSNSVIASESIDQRGLATIIRQPGRARAAAGPATYADGGDVRIAAESLSLEQGAGLSTSTVTPGDGGNLSVQAASVELRDGARIDSVSSGVPDVPRGGNAGSVAIDAGTVRLRDARISTSTFTRGRGGSLTVDAMVFEMRASDVESNSRRSPAGFFIGPGGAIEMTADRVRVLDQSRLQAETRTQGDGGALSIQAQTLTVAGESFVSTNSVVDETGGAALGAGGDAGAIRVDADTIEVRDDARIESDTLGPGAGGNLDLRADSVVVTRGGEISVDTTDFGDIFGDPIVLGPAGDGGTLTIEAGRVRVSDDARVAARSAGAGDGGEVVIDAGRLWVDGGEIRTQTTYRGNAGRLALVADDITLRDALVTSASEPMAGLTLPLAAYGDAGPIVVSSGDMGRVETEQATLSSRSETAGAAGFILLEGGGRLDLAASSLLVESERGGGGGLLLAGFDEVNVDRTRLEASAFGAEAGDGGNVVIDAGLLTVRKSDVLARANAGRGGNITLQGEQIFQDTESRLSATSDTGVDGDVRLLAPNVNVAGSLPTARAVPAPPSEVIVDGCEAARGSARSTLRVDSMHRRGRDPTSFVALADPGRTRAEAVTQTTAAQRCAGPRSRGREK